MADVLGNSAGVADELGGSVWSADELGNCARFFMEFKVAVRGFNSGARIAGGFDGGAVEFGLSTIIGSACDFPIDAASEAVFFGTICEISSLGSNTMDNWRTSSSSITKYMLKATTPLFKITAISASVCPSHFARTPPTRAHKMLRIQNGGSYYFNVNCIAFAIRQTPR